MLLGVAIGILLYAYLQYREDTAAQREGRPLPGTGQRVALFAVVVLVTGVLGHFIQNMGVEGRPLIGGGDAGSGGADAFMEAVLAQHRAGAGMRSRIPEDVFVGRPPF